MTSITVCGSLSRFPVSLGRTMHEAGYRALSLPWMYAPFACRDVAGAITGIRALSIRGVGVSMPYKLEVIPYLDALSPLAERIGAVNTIVNDDGRLTGHNTDAIGARRALEEATTLDGKRVLLLGAGGAARAVAVSLADAGAKLTIANRDVGKGEALAAHVGAVARDASEAGRAGEYDVVVNATSRGMADVDPSSPIPPGALGAGQVVMDIVYKPLETALVAQARAASATAIGGARMLLFQAMEQFRLYTGHEPPRAAMEGALLEALARPLALANLVRSPRPMPSSEAAPLSRAVGVGIALISACLLMAEVALTRVFSVTIWYHFAFLAISVALFGTGAAAVGLYVAQNRLDPERTGRDLGLSSLVLSGVILVSELVLLQVSSGWSSSLLGETGKLLTIFCASSAPFLVGGFTVGLAMTRHSANIHALYFWDLLGAALGCLLVIPAMDAVDAPRVLAATAVLAAVAGAALSTSSPGSGWKVGTKAGAGLAVAVLALVVLAPGVFRVRHAKGERIEDRHPEFTRWNSYSMVSVMPDEHFRGWGMSPRFAGKIPEQKSVFIDLNAMTTLTRFDGDFDKVRHGLHDATAFVHTVRPAAPSVCVIGAGAGKDVLAALTSGAKHVTAAELNPLIAEGVVRGAYRDFDGGLYDRADVTLRLGDGRATVRAATEKFDLVHLSMVDTSASTAAGAYVLSENSLYTIEAFRDYLEHLTPGGMLSVSSVSLPGLAVGERLVALARASAQATGGDPASSVLVISTPWLALPSATLFNVIVKRGAFTPDELARAHAGADRMGFRLAYVPGRAPGPGPEAVMALILTSTDEKALQAAMDTWPVDVSATTDDRPFFFYQNRMRDLASLMVPSSATMPFPFGNGLFILAKVLLVSLVMVGACIVLPLVIAARREQGATGRARDIAYVTLLGVGFMAVEIAMVHRVTLYLGRPSDGLAVVLFVLLSGGAVGSARSAVSDPVVRRKRLLGVLIALVVYLSLAFQSGLFVRVLDHTGAWAIGVRIAIACAFLAPLGVLLGVALPTWLAGVSVRAPARIPWLWGVNGATSVLGSVLATLVAMHAGISGSLWLGVGAYAMALVLAARAKETLGLRSPPLVPRDQPGDHRARADRQRSPRHARRDVRPVACECHVATLRCLPILRALPWTEFTRVNTPSLRIAAGERRREIPLILVWTRVARHHPRTAPGRLLRLWDRGDGRVANRRFLDRLTHRCRVRAPRVHRRLRRICGREPRVYAVPAVLHASRHRAGRARQLARCPRLGRRGSGRRRPTCRHPDRDEHPPSKPRRQRRHPRSLHSRYRGFFRGESSACPDDTSARSRGRSVGSTSSRRSPSARRSSSRTRPRPRQRPGATQPRTRSSPMRR